MIIGGSASTGIAEKLSKSTGLPLAKIEQKKFPDGEVYVKLAQEKIDEEAIIVQSTHFPQYENLAELLFLFAEHGRPEQVLAAGEVMLSRVPEGEAEPAAAHRLMGDASLQGGEKSADRAVRHYEAAVRLDPDPQRRLEALIRLIRILGLDRNDPSQAKALMERAESITRESGKPGPVIEAYREALDACGDAHLWYGRQPNIRQPR